MAEARTEDEEESLREPRGGGRNPRLANASSERAERNKPEQRHSSQGALSSIRAVIKRTSNRTTAQTDHSRDRRRPEITILSAEPLATNWFPGASGAFPPPPPPAQPSWASGGLTVQLPPPSYEQVIREKSREQNTHSSSVSSSSSSSPAPRRSTTTIATQTETGSSSPKNRTVPPAHRPPKPPRPSLPLAPKPAESASAHTHTLIELDKPDLPCTTNTPTTTHGSDILSAPLTEQCGVQTDFTEVPDDLETTPTLTDSSHIANDPPLQHPVKQEVSARPKPRPRSKAILQPVVTEEVLDQAMTREVKVQTLVRLKDDGGESVFAGFTDSSSDVSSNKYLQELLDAFGYDEQGFQGNQDSESDQSEKSEEDEEASESCDAPSVPTEPLEPLKRPQPKPRTHNPKPVIAPKPSEPMQEAKSSSEENIKQTLIPPVPAPRPLLTNKLSEGNRPDSNRLPRPPRPPVAARRSLVPANSEEAPSAHETAAVPPKSLVDDESVDDQARNSSSAPVRPAPFTSARSSGKCPTGSTQTQVPVRPPLQRRPPPPSNPNAQAAVSGVSVSKAPASSVPSLPPRPSEGRLLPLRPPPIKLSKSAGSTHAPATTSQLPSHRVPKRRPPLPPRPKPGHPLYRDYTSKVPQGNTKMSHAGTEPEEHYLQKEELLLVLDDTPVPTHTPSFPEEVKGQIQDVNDDVCPTVRNEPISQQKQNQEIKIDKQKEQKPQPNTDIRCVACFAFEGQKNELMFREGDVITLIEYVNEEWGRGSINGHTGLFPLNFVQEVPSSQRKPTPESPEPPVYEREGQTGRALYDFTAESEDELCLKVGDIVCSLEEVDEEWFMGEFAGKRGIVPKKYIQVL
ncbi:SH3 domain-containing protein 19 isoform X2 [Colossoma macropomum]|uniref:SH3 domain-containing protein 19 isoform X2 n=1 Tax=Colossoma macropomum TaxID=42526 RepID=UPI001864B164|nr:SH3 domain-containing protein 19 isoform X2 [Colossoma macropomum]